MSMSYKIVVSDKESFPVIVAEVIKVQPFDKSTGLFYYQEVHKYAERIGAKYVLIVAPSKMKLWDSSNGEILVEFDTAIALGPYIGKEFTLEEVSKHYLRVTLMLWFDDLIYPWKEAEAPYKKELEALGVLEQIEKGYVEIKVKE